MKLSVDGLVKEYGGDLVLKGFCGEARGGELVALLGVNGAGKTTLLRMVAGLAGWDQGEVCFDGRRFERDDVGMRKRLCFVPDVPVFFEDRSGLENIGVYLKLWGVEWEPLVDRAMDLLTELEVLGVANAPVSVLSRGQLYKLMLVALVLVDADLWLLDEPFASGMDPLGLRVMRREVRAAVGRGRLVIYTTQMYELVADFSDRVWVLKDGVLGLDVATGRLGDVEGEAAAMLGVYREGGV